ncbi:MAG TPA: 3-deoxy-manno-octulosonate cytidylyltransferase [Candidatus Paceibacterota bacterium]
MKKQKVLGIIPARLNSTRVPGKMLEDILGKPLIQRTLERTQKAQSLDALVVATDSPQIADIVKSLGVHVIMTPPEIPTGTDRVGVAAKQFTEFTPDIIVNIWGDEPLYPAEAIDECVSLLLEDEDLQVSGVGDLLESEVMVAEPSIVKVLTDLNNNVLMLSRSVVPFTHHKDNKGPVHHIIGVMAMRRDFLYTFLNLPQTPIELQEGVEQIRILEHGYRMRIVKGVYNNLGVNTPEELKKVTEIFRRRQNTPQT